MVEFKPVSEGDLLRLCKNARDEDVAEVAASSISSFEDAIRRSVASSDWVLSAYCGDDLLCVFGVGGTSVLSGYGAPWLIGTNQIKHHKKDFWKASHEVLGWMKSRADFLENYAHKKNTTAISWLKRLGFEFDEKEVDGLNGEKFLRFYLCVQ